MRYSDLNSDLNSHVLFESCTMTSKIAIASQLAHFTVNSKLFTVIFHQALIERGVIARGFDSTFLMYEISN